MAKSSSLTVVSSGKRAPGFGVLCTFPSCWLFVPLTKTETEHAWSPVGTGWGKSTTAIAGVTTRYTPAALAALSGRRHVSTFNHGSTLDVLVEASSFQTVACWCRKNSKTPVFGACLSIGGLVYLDRGNRERAYESLQRARQTDPGGEPAGTHCAGRYVRRKPLRSFQTWGISPGPHRSSERPARGHA